MREINRKVYIATDGAEFHSRELCEMHEKHIKEADNLKVMTEKIIDFCTENHKTYLNEYHDIVCNNTKCPLRNFGECIFGNNIPADWELEY